MPQNNKQSGNVFIIILIGIFLFSALMYTFSKSANQSTGNVTKQQAKIIAQEIISYASLVEGAVDRIRRNGCSETEISFDNAVVAGYSNPDSPPDKHCNIFEPEGGKIEYIDPLNTNWLDRSQSAKPAYGELGFSGQTWIYLVDPGTDINYAELLFWLTYIPKEVCLEINNLLNVENPLNNPPDYDFGPHIIPFIGTLGNGTGNGDSIGGATEITSAGCGLANSAVNLIGGASNTNLNGTYHFYSVLLAR